MESSPIYIQSLLHYIENAQENKKITIFSYNIAENSNVHGMITLVSFYKYNKIIHKRLCLLCFLLTRRLHFKSLENVKLV